MRRDATGCDAMRCDEMQRAPLQPIDHGCWPIDRDGLSARTDGATSVTRCFFFADKTRYCDCLDTTC